MKQASSLECCQGFMEWTSRFGLPSLLVSDNGNTFVANLWKDVMATFNIPVTFTPAYHAATNGAVERRHQTIKNALKASLVDMGNSHGSKWASALPWVLMGKRTAFQPDLDTSAALLTLGKSPQLPSQLLGVPGPPLNSLEIKSLLEQLYKMSAQPALPTSSVSKPLDISVTDSATHVYVKVENPKGLSGRFEGPYEIISRPSRSQVEVRIGSYASGAPRLQTYSWESCKIAHLRADAKPASRPNLGRKPAPQQDTSKKTTSDITQQETMTISADKVQTSTPVLDSSSTRPPRSTRNPNPQYVHSLVAPG